MKEFKLPKNVKTKWVKELRSNKYRQGTGELKFLGIDNKYSFCCLGVAKECKLTSSRTSFGDRNGFVSQRFLPINVQKKLVDFNDVEKWSFKKIANWIERNL